MFLPALAAAAKVWRSWTLAFVIVFLRADDAVFIASHAARFLVVLRGISSHDSMLGDMCRFRLVWGMLLFPAGRALPNALQLFSYSRVCPCYVRLLHLSRVCCRARAFHVVLPVALLIQGRQP